jgi:hypothetical protein
MLSMHRILALAPPLAVYIFGLVLASRRTGYYPRPANLARAAFMLLLAGWLVSNAMLELFDYLRFERSVPVDQVLWLNTMGLLINSITFVAGMLQLIFAVFADRENAGVPLSDSSAETRLTALKARLDGGLITAPEYDAARSKVLDSL